MNAQKKAAAQKQLAKNVKGNAKNAGTNATEVGATKCFATPCPGCSNCDPMREFKPGEMIVEIVGKKIAVPVLPANVSDTTLQTELHNRAIIVWKAINPKQVEKVNGEFEKIPASTQATIKQAIRDAFHLDDGKTDIEKSANVAANAVVIKEAQKQTKKADKAKEREEKKAQKTAEREAKKAKKTTPFVAAKQNAVNAYRTLVAARDKSASQSEFLSHLIKAKEEIEAALVAINATIDAKTTLEEVRA